MDLRREIQNIKNENKSNIDKKDKETFSKWLDGEKISEVDYENILDKMQECIDLGDGIKSFYYYDVLSVKGGKFGAYSFAFDFNNGFLKKFPSEFQIFLKELSYQKAIKEISKELERINILPIKYDASEEEIVNTILEIYNKYKENSQLVEFSFSRKWLLVFDRMNNMKYKHIIKTENVDRYVGYIIIYNELKNNKILWSESFNDVFEKLGIFDYNFYIKICGDYNIKYEIVHKNQNTCFMYLNDKDYEKFKEDVSRYHDLSKRMLTPIFNQFKEEFLSKTSLLVYGSYENDKKAEILNSIIDSLLIKNPDWKYRNIEFYVIESSSVPSVTVLYENLIFKFSISKMKNEKGIFEWQFYVSNDDCYSYIDRYTSSKLLVEDATTNIDLSLPKIDASRKSSVSNSAMMGGLLFGTTGAIAGAASAMERNAKIDQYNINNEPIIHTVKYKEYSLSFYAGSGNDYFAYPYIMKVTSKETLVQLSNKINNNKLSFEELCEKLKESNYIVLKKLKEEYISLDCKIKEKETEIEKYKYSLFGKKAVIKKKLIEEINLLNIKISYIKNILNEKSD